MNSESAQDLGIVELARPRRCSDVLRGRAPAMHGRQRGFTLIEIVAAFSVFAVAFALLMSVAGENLRQARRANDYTQAALYAQSKLDTLGVGEKISEGHDGGRFDDRFSYELDVAKSEPPAAGNGTKDMIPIELFKLELIVHWDDAGKDRSARFATLRAMQADPSGGFGK